MHPCRACGACCAALRVSFHEGEVALRGVPIGLTEPRSPEHLAMRGTPGRCVALEGEVGRFTTCAIHPVRPSPCEAFTPSWERGEPNPWCDDARTRHGLPLLTRESW